MADRPSDANDTDPLADTHASDADSSPAAASKKRAVHVGDVLGRYELVEEVGEGGMASVYRARDRELRREVAVKVLFPHLARRPEIVRRFQREARAAATLEQRNILRVYDVGGGEGDDPPYIVMELIRGRSVRDLIERAELTARRTLVIARQVLEAIAHVHGKGIVHRDLKPDNIMVVEVGYDRVKLVDFGLIKVLGEAPLGTTARTQTGLVFGTPAYMSPEQAAGQPVDARADLYALGSVVFEMLTGRPPFRSPDPATMVRMHASAPPPTLASVAPGQPWCTQELEALIAQALVKDPAARFSTAEAMTAALDAAFVSLDHLP